MGGNRGAARLPATKDPPRTRKASTEGVVIIMVVKETWTVGVGGREGGGGSTK